MCPRTRRYADNLYSSVRIYMCPRTRSDLYDRAFACSFRTGILDDISGVFVRTRRHEDAYVVA